MQVKVREMKAEIARLTEQVEMGEREKSAKKHYEKRVKELAQELTGRCSLIKELKFDEKFNENLTGPSTVKPPINNSRVKFSSTFLILSSVPSPQFV